MSDQEPWAKEEGAGPLTQHDAKVDTQAETQNGEQLPPPSELPNEAGGTICAGVYKPERRLADPPSPIRVLAVGLLYPAALGAALAWYIQALVPFYASRVYGTTLVTPSSWTLIAGLWFLVYHSAWYVARNAARRKDSPWPPEGRYRCRSFVSDVFDIGALLIAFVALDLVSGAYRQPLLCIVYGSMFLAALAAAIMRGSILTGLALLVSVIGAVLHLAGAELPKSIDWVILVSMWTLLVLYILSRLGGVSHPYVDALVQTQLWGPQGTWKKPGSGEGAA